MKLNHKTQRTRDGILYGEEIIHTRKFALLYGLNGDAWVSMDSRLWHKQAETVAFLETRVINMVCPMFEKGRLIDRRQYVRPQGYIWNDDYTLVTVDFSYGFNLLDTLYLDDEELRLFFLDGILAAMSDENLRAMLIEDEKSRNSRYELYKSSGSGSGWELGYPSLKSREEEWLKSREIVTDIRAKLLYEARAEIVNSEVSEDILPEVPHKYYPEDTTGGTFEEYYRRKFGSEYVETPNVTKLKKSLPVSMEVYSEPWATWGVLLTFIWRPLTAHPYKALSYSKVVWDGLVDDCSKDILDEVKTAFGVRMVSVFTDWTDKERE
jgi:hypothetical protein